jgi:outer membrane protein insertion porin family
MFATQTITSASLGLVLAGPLGLAFGVWPATARADPDPSATSPDGASGRIQLGAGYATDDKLFLTANVSQPNLFGTGDSLAIFAGVSDLHELFRVDFVQPHILDSDLTLTTELLADQRVMPGFLRRATGGTTTVSEQLSDHVRAYFGYRLEQVWGEATPELALAPTTGGPPLGNDLISAVRAGISYDTRDTANLPTHGSDAGIGIEYASPLLGSQLQLGTLDAWAGTNQPIGPTILHLDGSFTALESPGVLPLADRLFMMGSTDVRGFLPGAFGPTDAQGNPIGGNMKLTGRASLEVPIASSGLSLEGFLDYARIWDSGGPNPLRPAQLDGKSVGLGVIWRSPLGPVRVDVALPLVRGGSPTFVFGIGNLF